MSNVKIEESWKRVLASEFEQPYFQAVTTFVRKELADGKTLYPPGPLIFNAFSQTPFDKVKVVILGQDPYHNAGQAMGLSFSVPQTVKAPPSLVNVYKEIKADLDLPIPTHGDLTSWAQQGVFLLNAILTVEAGNAGSHQKSGWQFFTDAVIKRLSDEREHLIFMLWGNFARNKRVYIDKTKHLILEAAHPSPLAGNAFSGCRHFSQANEYLVKHGLAPIDWRII
jgi:uracil-DNA glycosylase